MSESSEYTAFLVDSRKNVMEKIRVNEPRCSFHGRLLKFGETYDVEVGGFRRSVGLIGTLVLCDVIIFYSDCDKMYIAWFHRLRP